MNHGHGSFSLSEDTQITNSAVGNGATNHVVTPAQFSGTVDSGTTDTSPWDVGVVTILTGEMRAVIDQLGLNQVRKTDGLRYHTGEVEAEGGPFNIVAARTLHPGQRSVMSALEHLRRHFDPGVLVLVGIGGSIHPRCKRIGDVVVSTRVVYYESRKLEEGGHVQYRTEEREAPARGQRALNSYFIDNGEPAMIRGQADGHRKRTFEVHTGPIASGEAVIADHGSEVRRHLKAVNDKILAVDMEAGGLSQFWQENSAGSGTNPDWVVVRGVSDNADRSKGDEGHGIAAHNAAFVVRQLLPYLC